MGVTCTADVFGTDGNSALWHIDVALCSEDARCPTYSAAVVAVSCRDECHFAYGILVLRLVQELVKGSNAIVKSKFFTDYPEHGINATKGLECLLAKTG